MFIEKWYTISDRRQFGVEVKAYRESQGLTQRELGVKVSLAGGTISRIENGRRLGEESLQKIADLLAEAKYVNHHEGECGITYSSREGVIVFIEKRYAISNRKQFGIQVKAYRESQGLTQRELGVRVGLAGGTISRIENGIGGIGEGSVEKVANFLQSQIGITHNQSDIYSEL